ncbi:MAG: rRNA maturation RNase YbeY [Candidatus Pelagibacter sp. TMED118]|nr:MAG: rRNA maturation RNase YbeY [Candidatus Pelagibacter sp. TMED118]|tara:strand:+ start:1402 stop:1842 length:441 start_codon:yes stop_codon:yes gene_type:complete
MIKANIIVDKNVWKNKIKNPEYYIKNKLKKIPKILKLKLKKQEISLFLTNSKKMRELNYKFRKKNKIADILSFPFSAKKIKNGYLGDIAISYEMVKQRSKKTNFKIEFDKMWVHGYLHLIGFNHKKLNEFKIMNKIENKILKQIER